jgi:hypothetical protein
MHKEQQPLKESIGYRQVSTYSSQPPFGSLFILEKVSSKEYLCEYSIKYPSLVALQDFVLGVISE